MEEVKCKVVVALAGGDRIVASPLVKHYIERHPEPVKGGSSEPANQRTRVLYWDDRIHGAVLVSEDLQDELRNAMLSQLDSHMPKRADHS
jgi:hypothetical protein